MLATKFDSEQNSTDIVTQQFDNVEKEIDTYLSAF
jgi:hypothetical protein